ncbi:MAG: histidine--tRNA ligase [Methanocellales archaeon]|nr:histidine--tRNA ligase [Methanocellales archaeon]MDD3292249.1 histidine--tRNA ligase [Methanocellales archaeon]MDD5235955.1 histidine--tRNA ligase [Methanocellales archaeon]MDD5484865.1 histidine--tRNA ligase [Methanocellales archaeon]
MKIQRPRGTQDFLPEEMAKRRFIESKMRKTVESWGYQEIQTPIFESLYLFTLRSGDTIIDQSYIFDDKGGRKLILRPELTEPVTRLYVEKLQADPKPLKLYYFSNCFRYERPQKGRFREFWQFGVELIGSDRPEAEVEVIALASSVLDNIGLKGDLHVGHLGALRSLIGDLSDEQKNAIIRSIDKRDYEGLRTYLDEIGATALEENIRALIKSEDIKEARETVGDVPALERLEDISDQLDLYGISHKIDFSVARGLEYYTGMVFEIYAEGLGTENQICGGGSYRLAHLFGGEDTPSTGFAFGFDRVIMALGDIKLPQQTKVMIVSTKEQREWARTKVAPRIRKYFPTEVDLMDRDINGQLSRANAIGATHVVIVGERELQKGEEFVTLKGMKTGEQETLTMEEAIKRIRLDEV